MENAPIIQANTKQILEDYPELREPLMRKQAHIKYWQVFEGVGDFGIALNKYPTLTSAETISRAIRKIQELNPNLRTSKQGKEIKRQMEQDFREEYAKKNN